MNLLVINIIIIHYYHLH